ncbi:3469_t:CDS:2 [Ambispora gerdemannii]|uniref:3469_t:CDS:1 n=1 Tax=Ambispora gerdemannii TaxID=144530 RepID=A0A9N8WLI0_9GLOM|nr:3469_t:CDS:2 [Ambispora gerdemannii]
MPMNFSHGGFKGVCRIPHSSGSLDEKIENEFHFNIEVARTKADDQNEITLDLQVQIQGKKAYGEWGIHEVFRDILHQNFADVPKFNLVFSQRPFTDDELKLFNRSRIRVRFHEIAVAHIRRYTNDTAQLSVETDLDGSRGYGPVDYLCERGNAIIFICIFSVIVRQAQARQNGLWVTTLIRHCNDGIYLAFHSLDGSPENPTVEISCDYACDFTGDMQSAKDVEAENTKLKQIMEQNAKRKAENIEFKAEVAKLRHDIEEIKKQTRVIINEQEASSTQDISHSPTSSPLPVTSPSPIENQTRVSATSTESKTSDSSGSTKLSEAKVSVPQLLNTKRPRQSFRTLPVLPISIQY